MAQNVITGLDIGSNSIKAVVLEVKKKKTAKLSVAAAIKKPSAGMRKGAITDVADAAVAVARVFGELKKFPAMPRGMFLGIGDTHVKAHVSRGIIAVSRADNGFPKTTWKESGKPPRRCLSFLPTGRLFTIFPASHIVDGVGASVIRPE